jgi:ribosome-associated translation inhibitor RaiA
MHVNVNTSNGIENKESLERWAAAYLNQHLARFAQDLGGVDVQLTDEHRGSNKGGDKRCMLEARINGRSPVAVTNNGADQDVAFRGAVEKLEHTLDRVLGKLDRREHRERDTIRRDAGALP